jgi:HD-like signal output (HDOD) protein
MQQALPEYGLTEGALWRHSVAAALAAESAQPFCRASLPAETHAAALLHDVGKLVMARFLSPEILRILADAREKGGLSSLRAEAELLCVHHGELGGIIAQHWNLSDRIVTGIMYHHMPDLARDIVADVVHVANIAAKLAGTGHVATGADLQVSPTSLERLGMSTDGFMELTARVGTQLESVLAAYAG